MWLPARTTAPGTTREALEQILLRVSEMVCELPQLRELDINPIIVDEQGAVAVDARLIVGNTTLSTRPYQQLSILPYPARFEQTWPLPGGNHYTIRPIHPDDADMLQQLKLDERFVLYFHTKLTWHSPEANAHGSSGANGSANGGANGGGTPASNGRTGGSSNGGSSGGSPWVLGSVVAGGRQLLVTLQPCSAPAAAGRHGWSPILPLLLSLLSVYASLTPPLPRLP